jgi:methionyl-tRNA formyltransferase
MSRIVFLGTPGAAVPALRSLVGGFDVGLVVTSPDRPRGRSGHPEPSPVGVAASELGLTVAKPENRDQLYAELEETGPFDVGVVVAYGMILEPRALDVPRLGMLNAHFSLLPRWRGAAPVARALIAGDPMTGVTIIRLDQGLDTGAVLTAQAVDISGDEIAGELTERLAGLGARLLTGVLPSYLSGETTPVPQTDEGATYASKLAPGDRPLRSSMTRLEAVHLVRGLSPEPGATLDIDGETHQVLRARTHTAAPAAGSWDLIAGSPVIGVVDGGVELVEIKAPGRREMSGADWGRGRRSSSGRFS